MSVRIDRIGEVVEIVLDRPDHRNALTPPMLETVCASLTGGRAYLIRGEGKVFCAGFDLKMCAEDESVLRALLKGLDATVRAMKSCPAPVVLAAQGAAIAGGCALLAGADVVVSDAGAKLGYPVALLGISPAVSAPSLTRAIGHGAARSRMLDPGVVDGRAAHQVGLVHELVQARDDVVVRAREVAAKLASKPTVGLEATKGWLGELDHRAAEADGLGVSLDLVGGSEQREMLARAWAMHRSRKG